MKIASALPGALVLLYIWRLVAQLRSVRRQLGWSSLRKSPLWRKVVRVVLLVVVPLAVTVGWWVVVYRLPLVGGFATKYSYSSFLPLSLQYITATLIVWSLVLITSAFCPRTSSKKVERSGRKDSYS